MLADDDLDEPLLVLERHLNTQIMKEVSTFRMGKSTKRNCGRCAGGAVYGN